MRIEWDGVLTDTGVYCWECGAVPGTACVTPSGKIAKQSHHDRRADVEAITRHLDWMAVHQ